MHAVSVRLSGYLTFLYSVETNKYIFQNFSASGNHTILVFLRQILWQYFDGDLTFRRGPPNIIINIKNECHSNIVVDRLQGYVEFVLDYIMLVLVWRTK